MFPDAVSALQVDAPSKNSKSRRVRRVRGVRYQIQERLMALLIWNGFAPETEEPLDDVFFHLQRFFLYILYIAILKNK
ncbi:hypothetical protein D1872_245160 [compost metagenome]